MARRKQKRPQRPSFTPSSTSTPARKNTGLPTTNNDGNLSTAVVSDRNERGTNSNRHSVIEERSEPGTDESQLSGNQTEPEDENGPVSKRLKFNPDLSTNLQNNKQSAKNNKTTNGDNDQQSRSRDSSLKSHTSSDKNDQQRRKSQPASSQNRHRSSSHQPNNVNTSEDNQPIPDNPSYNGHSKNRMRSSNAKKSHIQSKRNEHKESISDVVNGDVEAKRGHSSRYPGKRKSSLKDGKRSSTKKKKGEISTKKSKRNNESKAAKNKRIQQNTRYGIIDIEVNILCFALEIYRALYIGINRHSLQIF